MANSKSSPERLVREIKRKTRRVFNAEEKIQIILEGLRGEDSISAICRREGIHPSQYVHQACVENVTLCIFHIVYPCLI